MSKLYEIIEKPLSGEWGSEDETGKGVPVLRTTNFTNEGVIDYSNVVTRLIDLSKSRSKFLRYGDIIIEKSGGSPSQPVGRVVFFDGEENKYLFNNFTSVLRVKDQNNCFPKYLFYQLFSKYRSGFTQKYQNKTTGISNLKLDRFIKEVEVYLPSLEIQKQITDTLDTAAELLAKRKQQLAELDNITKSIFYDMFGDPVTNEKGWEVKTVNDICSKILGGGTPTKSKKEYYMGNIPWVTPKDMKTIRIFDSLDHISEEAIKNSSTKLIPSNSVLMVVRSGILKKSLPVAINTVDVTINQDMKAFITNEQVVSEYLLYFFIFIQNHILKHVRAVTADNIEFSIIKNVKIPVPPIYIQNQFANIVAKIEEQKALVKKAIDETQALFDSLMSQYFD
jgi:type I restriction enzyme S subunit